MSAAAVRGVDGLLQAAGIDPGAGVQIVAADRLPAVAFDPSLPLVVLAGSSSVAPALPGRHARSGGHAVLSALYPATHPLMRLSDLALLALETLDDARLAAADWLVPALEPIENLASPHGIAAISARLRAPDGCPWDRKQTHLSLRPYLLEEAYETVDAIENGSSAELAEELGDLLLQVILHAQFSAEEGHFDLTDVYRSIAAKIVRRHPHVFGELEVDSVEQLMTTWESIKADEREASGKADEGAFGGVARALPALPASREIQERASALGWDWDAIGGVWEKVAEELDELRDATGDDERLHELGDTLFALVNLGRWMKLDPEEALRAANHRWVARYRAVERLAAERGVELESLSLAEKDVLWDEVKASDAP
ncbi:MAG TPA: nucleoside triphosphate pyrophosphohydrolase [Candidatus Limnocylindria bacterium]|nr:nucleoside triphosphate pyrophosphohydrolase [Candidatus Limnocylindria bacterium]